jgi:type IV pilus assembly protein PilM
MSDAVSYFTREFYKGGDDLTDAISKKLSLEMKDAEALKRNPADELEKVQDCIGGVIEDVCHDINISIDYFENQYDKKVEEVYITGGASSSPGLPETLERTLQRPVNRWDPLQYIDVEGLPRESAQELKDYAPQAAIALGLASRVRRD